MKARRSCWFEGVRSFAACGDVAEEEDNAIIEGTSLYGQPKVERIRIEGFTLAGDAFVEGEIEEISPG